MRSILEPIFLAGKGREKMSTTTLWKTLSERRISLSGEAAGCPQRWLWRSLECHHKDEIVLLGESEYVGESVLGYDCKFSDGLHGNLLAVGDEEGFVHFLDTRKVLSEATINKLSCHDNSVNSIAWITGGARLLTASREVCLWDVVSSTRLSTFKFHQASIKTVDSNRDEPSLIVSGCQHGSICVWDTRCSSASTRPVNIIHEAHVPQGSPRPANTSVRSAQFFADSKIASVGSADRVVKLWDMRKNYSSVKSKHLRAWFCFEPAQKGHTALIVDSRKSCLYATSVDNRIYRYTSGVSKPVATFSGAEMSSFYIRTCLSPDDKFLLSGSSCGNGFIWEVDKPLLGSMVLSGRGEEVMGVSWSPTLDQLAMTTSGSQVRMWRVQRRRGRGHHSQLEITGTCSDANHEEMEVSQTTPIPSVATPTTATPTSPTPLAQNPATVGVVIRTTPTSAGGATSTPHPRVAATPTRTVPTPRRIAASRRPPLQPLNNSVTSRRKKRRLSAPAAPVSRSLRNYFKPAQ